MATCVTLTCQIILEDDDEDSYQDELDGIIFALEEQGFQVSLESEEEKEADDND